MEGVLETNHPRPPFVVAGELDCVLDRLGAPLPLLAKGLDGAGVLLRDRPARLDVCEGLLEEGRPVRGRG